MTTINSISLLPTSLQKPDAQVAETASQKLAKSDNFCGWPGTVSADTLSRVCNTGSQRNRLPSAEVNASTQPSTDKANQLNGISKIALSGKQRAINKNPLVFDFTDRNEKNDSGLRRHRDGQINKWRGQGTSISLVDTSATKIGLKLNGPEIMASPVGGSIRMGRNPNDGYTMGLTNSKSGVIDRADLVETIQTATNLTSNSKQSSLREEIYVNSHLTGGEITGINGFPKLGSWHGGYPNINQFSRMLIDVGVAGKGSNIIYTGCMIPSYAEIVVPQLKELAIKHGLTIHYPTQRQSTGPLHDMMQVKPDGSVSASPYNGR
jgi:hypothetical protein